MDDFDKKIQTLINNNMNITDEGKTAIDNTLRNLKTQSSNRTIFPIFNKISRIATIGILAASAVSVCAYTGGKIYEKYKYEQTSTQSIALELPEHDKYNNHYKKITNYEEYTEYLTVNNNLVKMSENDFEDNFLLIISSFSSMNSGVKINNIYSENNKLYIELGKDTVDENEGNSIVSVKISKEFQNLDINIIIIPGTNEVKKYGFTPFSELTPDYKDKQAIAENCVMISYHHIAPGDKFKLDKFVEDTRNGIESCIRVVRTGNFDDSTICVIQDTIYKNGKYYICNYNMGSTDYPESTFIDAGTSVVVEENTFVGTTYSVRLIDDNGMESYCHFADFYTE